jgi:aldehyde dehydrogenase (NAD+)
LTAEVQGHVINGELVEPLSGTYIDVLNPVTGEVVGKTAAGNADDIDRAVAAAKAAFPAWRTTPASDRAASIARIAMVLGGNLEELVQLECSCTGVLSSRMMSFDVPGLMQLVQNFAENLEDYPFVEYPPVRPLPEAHDVKILKQPLGVCGLISPWNGPLFLTLVKMLPAIAAGNTVVVKPAETASLAVVRFIELLQTVLPVGVVNVVTGYGHEAGSALSTHPDVAKISFTGSGKTGAMIQKVAADSMKRVTLELGGKGANIVMPDAPLELAARGSTFAFLFHSGQICVSGTRLFVHESIHDQLVERMVELASVMKAGSQFDPETSLAPMAFRGHYDRVMSYIESAREQGATLACGGEPMVVAEFPNSLFIQPTIFTDVTPEMRIYQEEIFGPVLSVIKYTDVDDAIRMANDSCYGLSAGVWSGDPIAAQSVARQLEAGLVWVNDWHALTADASFGGVKQSGYGREINLASMESYLETRTYMTSFETNPDAKVMQGLLHKNV